MALSLLLAAGAGLFVRTLMNLEHENLGFNAHGLLLFGVDPTQNGYKGARLVTLYDRLLDHIRSLPSVQGASISAFALMSGWQNDGPIAVEGGQNNADQNPTVLWNIVGPDFLKTMGIRLLLGRGIGDHDTSTSPRVAVVNEALARKFFGNLDPLAASPWARLRPSLTTPTRS